MITFQIDTENECLYFFLLSNVTYQQNIDLIYNKIEEKVQNNLKLRSGYRYKHFYKHILQCCMFTPINKTDLKNLIITVLFIVVPLIKTFKIWPQVGYHAMDTLCLSGHYLSQLVDVLPKFLFREGKRRVHNLCHHFKCTKHDKPRHLL